MRVQFAIDTLSSESAIRAADSAVAAGIDTLEAGHVLIKAVGVAVVAELRKRFIELQIVADMKTMDMGHDEVSIAAEAGADIVIVCAAASDGVLTAARNAASLHSVGLMVSLMGVRNRVVRAAQLIDLGLPHVIAHRGIDDVFLWSENEPMSELTDLARLPGIQLALAGGMNATTFPQFADLPLERVIVGRGITESDDLSRAVTSIRALAEQSSPSGRTSESCSGGVRAL
jgi:3-hexulose-6-phosphate synthase